MAREATAAPGVVQGLRDRDTSGERTDAELLQQFLSRTDDSAEIAFAALVERHGPIVQRVCLDVLGSLHEAQDAAQAVFLVLARKARSIRKPESLGPWLHGVALRVSRRARKEAARRRVAERGKSEVMQRRHAVELGPEPFDYAELHEEIDRLPEQYRDPIILCYMQGQTQPQAARQLGWPLGTVQIRLHRGRERLRSRLTRRGAGLIAATGSDLVTSLAVPGGVLGRAWTETTARAAVRFAAGKGSAGLVAPAVTGLARSVLTAMVVDSLKVVALSASALLLVAAGLALIGRSAKDDPRAGSRVEPGRGAAPTLIKHGPAPKATGLETPVEIAGKKDQPAVSVVQAKEKPPAVERSATAALGTRALMTPPKDHSVDDGARLTRTASLDRSRSLASVGRRSKETLTAGRDLFERTWVKNDPRGHGGDGLGPVFNAQSCIACHNLGGSGGAGAIDRNIEIATVSEDVAGYTGFTYSFSMDFGAGKFEYRMGDNLQASSRGLPRADSRLLAAIHAGFQDARSVVLHRYGTDPTYNAWRELVPGRHGLISVRSSERNPPPLFGAGLIDAIPGEAIEAAARRRLAGSPQVKGRVSRLKDGRIGRFGWKAQTATLEEFVLSAAAGEVGLETPGRRQAADPRLPGLAARGLDMDEQDCDFLVDYVRSLPVPVAAQPADDKDTAQIKAGEAAFKSTGCTACHLPKLGDIEGIYSDLLLHDMGPQLGDADNYTVFAGEPSRAGAAGPADHLRAGTDAASAREWRTPPLWGLRDSGPYLHDGRAAGIAQAISLHAGQGASSARRFAELSPRRKQQIEAFLMSLAAPAADR